MTGKSREPKKVGSGTGSGRPEAPSAKPAAPAMLPAGPHAEAHLTNPDATPGTGSLTKADHGEVETDPGGG
jgi:hypothetical protein